MIDLSSSFQQQATADMSVGARFTIEDYDRMIASGVFDAPQRRRIELIHGELREMNPIGPNHEHYVDLLTEWSFKHPLGSDVRVRIQNSIGIPELDSAPEPDIAWVIKKDYRKSRPKNRDVLLVIEVAQSSLEYDRGEKAALYSSAGIEDYWVVDIESQCIEVCCKPGKKGYREKTTYEAGQWVAPLRRPKAKLSVSSLFE